MDHQKQMTPMDPYDQSIPIEKVLGQESKWMDACKLASVNGKDRDPVSASNVAWLIYNGHVPKGECEWKCEHVSPTRDQTLTSHGREITVDNSRRLSPHTLRNRVAQSIGLSIGLVTQVRFLSGYQHLDYASATSLSNGSSEANDADGSI